MPSCNTYRLTWVSLTLDVGISSWLLQQSAALVQGKEQGLRFAGAAMKRYPASYYYIIAKMERSILITFTYNCEYSYVIS